MDNEINKIVEQLEMKKLFKSDFMKEDYSSEIMIKIENGSRPLFNWAYYLIPEGNILPLHKLLSDESWQYCLGGPMDLFYIKNGNIETVRIGPNIFKGEKLLYIMEKNTWFAATPASGSKFTLITHCVVPGWVPEDDIPGYYEEMVQLVPTYPEFIKKYSWPKDQETFQELEYTKETEKTFLEFS